MNEVNEEKISVVNVSVQKSNGHNLMKVEEFLKFPIVDRAKWIMDKKVVYLDENGDPVPLMVAVKEMAILKKRYSK